MAEFTFFTNPQSRAWIVWWALNEVSADYKPELVEWSNKPRALLDANPLGKVPTIVHHCAGSDHVVTEAAAICHYLAETHPDAGLLPLAKERADYFRLMFYVAGPVEQALIADAMGWKSEDPSRHAMLGFGNYTLAMDTLETLLARFDYVCCQVPKCGHGSSHLEVSFNALNLLLYLWSESSWDLPGQIGILGKIGSGLLTGLGFA